MHIGAACASVRRTTALFRVTISLDSRNAPEKVIPIAGTQRCLTDHVIFNDTAGRRFLNAESRRNCYYTDALSYPADFQSEIKPGLLANFKNHVLIDCLLETTSFHHHDVRADRQTSECVVAGGIGRS